MQKKTISVIIPMYNESRYIARCLDSLKEQSYQDFELILIDDGSKDNTVEIAKGYAKDFHLTILQQKNSGPGKARNRGAKEAKGDILIFVDADMFFDKEYVNNLIQPILKGKDIGSAHGQELVGNPDNKLAIARCLNRIPHPEKRSSVYRAIKRDIFLESGGFDPSKGYFDDKLSKINQGKGALTVMNAICYHNNPESIKEIYKHSQRVGKSLVQSGEIKNYLRKYRAWLIALIGILLLGIIFFSHQLWGVLAVILMGIIILIAYKSIQRSIKEKHGSHLIYIPIMMISRGAGYLVGIIKYLFIKK